MTYTHAEERRALNRLFIDMKRARCPEPGCPGSMDYQPPYPAEPDTGTASWPGGATCDVCGFVVVDEPIDADAMVKHRRGA